MPCHSINWDKYNQIFIIITGDYFNECKLLYTQDFFKTVEIIGQHLKLGELFQLL
jgi:hypothetical protein